MALSIQHTEPMAKDPRDHFVYPDQPTPESNEYSKAKNRAERIANGIDPDTGKMVDAFATLVPLLKQFTAEHPSAVVEFRPRSSRASAHAEDVLEAQLIESRDSERIAEMVADVMWGTTHLSDLERSQYSNARAVATHAIRRLNPRWVQAAQKAARESCVNALRTECGAAFVGLPDAQLQSIAGILTGHILASYFWVTEGSPGISPKAYADITKGVKK